MDFINYDSALELTPDDEPSSDAKDIEYITHDYGSIETLIDFGTVADSEVINIEDVVNALTTRLKVVPISNDKKDEEIQCQSYAA